MNLTIRKRGTLLDTLEIRGDVEGVRALHEVLTSALTGAVLHADEASYRVDAMPPELGLHIAVTVER